MVTKIYKLARPMLRGVPCQIINGVPQGVTNRMVKDILGDLPQFNGEIVVGKPTAEDCHEVTVRWLEQRDAFFLFVYWVYDLKTTAPMNLRERLKVAEPMVLASGVNVQFADHQLIESQEQLDAYKDLVINKAKYPGIVLREPFGTFGTFDDEITKA